MHLLVNTEYIAKMKARRTEKACQIRVTLRKSLYRLQVGRFLQYLYPRELLIIWTVTQYHLPNQISMMSFLTWFQKKWRFENQTCPYIPSNLIKDVILLCITYILYKNIWSEITKIMKHQLPYHLSAFNSLQVLSLQKLA